MSLCPLKRQLVCLLIASLQKLVYPSTPRPSPPKKKVPGAATAYSSVKCFSKIGYCPVRKVKDVLPSNISCPFLVLLYMANFKI